MIKYILVALSLLAGCDRNCDSPNRPQYPEIGGCLTDAVAGEGGGNCIAGVWGNPYYCHDGFTCIDATCYSCGHLGEPCCGSQSSSDPGSCTEGNCAKGSGEEWYTCQGDAATPPTPGCAAGDKPSYYVWVLSAVCEAEWLSFCAVDDAAAQAYVDANFGDVAHGPFGPTPEAVAPKTWYVCPSGEGCVVGSSDGSLATSFSAFTHDQLVACEAAYDSQCTWADTQNDTCPTQL